MFEVDASQFCTALRAIVPHASDDEDAVAFFRVQVTATPDEVMMTAGCLVSYGLIRLKTAAQGDGHTALHLRPSDIAHIVKLFKPGKDTYPTIQVGADAAGRVTLTERIGIGFDGRVLKLPALAGAEEAPDLAGLIKGLLMHSAADVRPVTELYSHALAAIAASATALSEQVVIEATVENGPMLVRLGERFVGLAAARRRDEADALRDRERIRGEWLVRLQDPDEQLLARLREDHIVTLSPDRPAPADDRDSDDLVAEAAGLIIGTQFASTSMLQRKLRVGFVKAGWLMDQLEEFGVVGPEEGTAPREVLVEVEDHDKVVTAIRDGQSPEQIADLIGGQVAMDLSASFEEPAKA